MAEQAQIFAATGRRKSAVAQVRVSHGSGRILVNRRSLDNYFVRPASRMIVNQPFEITETLGRWDVSVNVKGGGVSAQAQAVRHGITRALMEYDATLRGALKRAGFVTRDARAVERKKYGQPGARKKFQFSKR